MKFDSRSDLSGISYAGSVLANVAPNIESGAKTMPNKGNTLISSQTSITTGLNINKNDHHYNSNSKLSETENQTYYYHSHQAKMNKLTSMGSNPSLALSDKDKFLSQTRELSENLSDHQVKMQRINERNLSLQNSD